MCPGHREKRAAPLPPRPGRRVVARRARHRTATRVRPGTGHAVVGGLLREQMTMAARPPTHDLDSRDPVLALAMQPVRHPLAIPRLCHSAARPEPLAIAPLS